MPGEAGCTEARQPLHLVVEAIAAVRLSQFSLLSGECGEFYEQQRFELRERSHYCPA